MSTEAGRLIDMKQRRKYLRTRYKVLLDEASRVYKPYTGRFCDPDDDPTFDRNMAIYEHAQERLREAKCELDAFELEFACCYPQCVNLTQIKLM